MSKFFLMCLFLLSTPVYAAPFLVSGPFPAGSVLPEQCILRQVGQPDKVTALHTDATGGKRCAWDLAGYSAAVHTFTMHSKKGTVESATGTPATCDLRAPSAPPAAVVMPELP